MALYNEAKDTDSNRKHRAVMYNIHNKLGLYSLAQKVGRMEWVKKGIRYRLAEFLYNPDYGPSVPFEADFFGYRYHGDLNCYVDWEVYFFGAFEKPILDFLQSLLPSSKGNTILDIGANVGHHTLHLSKFGTVHSFEPWDKVRKKLEEKVATNHLKNVTVYPVGLSNQNSNQTFYAPLGGNTGTGSFDATHSTDRNRLLGELKVVKGDEYLSDKNIGHIDLIKIDVEGWEKYALLGLKKTIEDSRPAIFLEFSDTTLRSFAPGERLLDLLPSGYEASYVTFKGGRAQFIPFDQSTPGDVLLRPARA